MLRESKMIRGNVVGLKVLGNGELKHALKIEAHKVSASAREKIEGAGGTITLREMKRLDGPRHEAKAKPASETAEASSGEKEKPAAKKIFRQKNRREKEIVRKELTL